MAKKKKEKKNRKGKSNSKPTNTSVGEAIKKAGIDKTKLPAVKSIVRSKIGIDDISGFGSKVGPKGKPGKKKLAVHTVLADFTALCDARIVDLKVNDSIDASETTCKKCLSNRVYKEYFAVLNGPPAKEKPADKPKPKEKPAKEVKTKAGDAKKADKPTPDKALKPEPVAPPTSADDAPDSKDSNDYEDEEVEIIEIDKLVDELETQVMHKMNIRIKKLEERLFEKLKAECQILLEARPRFYLLRKGNNMWQIVHDPSRVIVIDNVKESIAVKALDKLLAIPFHWDGTSKPPSEWVTEVTKIGVECAKVAKGSVDDKQRKVKRRSIKRRKDRPEPKPRKIRRRQK